MQAMKEGGCLLVDEISLAEDAVLERLNSLLEFKRTLIVTALANCDSIVRYIPPYLNVTVHDMVPE